MSAGCLLHSRKVSCDEHFVVHLDPICGSILPWCAVAGFTPAQAVQAMAAPTAETAVEAPAHALDSSRRPTNDTAQGRMQ